MTEKQPRRKLTLEAITASAAQYRSRSAWKRADCSAYEAARKSGLLDTVCAHMDPVPSSQALSLAEIRASAALYPTRQAWERGHPSAYNAAKQHQLFDVVCGHMPASPRKLPLEALMASAARYQSRGDWKNADPSAYLSAYRRGLLDVVCAHMTSKLRPSGYWTLERCKASAAAYTRRGDWQKAASNAYAHAQKNGWLDLCCAHMSKQQRDRKWTHKAIEASAQRFNSKTSWHREEHGAYSAAKQLGIFEQVTTHMA
ncbi:hypothetical protein U5801_22120 [Lamprobacter modestohalophilus]|uniref:hypothetical protein n=1 Tax=Lamprobacter modestohalophilus TaxID=1064514 RepID=UPI002ADEBDAB|nr:hypothetical protein [Lamprobacter modestohalophilus]MEA1052480.1 hypothetical protein [Lamprobacter modestohalophilus]